MFKNYQILNDKWKSWDLINFQEKHMDKDE